MSAPRIGAFACFALAVLFALSPRIRSFGQDAGPVMNRVPARDGRGEAIQCSGVNADLEALARLMSDELSWDPSTFEVLKIGPEVFEVRLHTGAIADSEFEKIRAVVLNHDDAQLKQGKTGIIKAPPQTTRSPAPPPLAWRERYAKATSDPERIALMAAYLGLTDSEKERAK